MVDAQYISSQISIKCRASRIDSNPTFRAPINALFLVSGRAQSTPIVKRGRLFHASGRWYLSFVDALSSLPLGHRCRKVSIGITHL